jgi:hypothetical protein
LYLFPFVPWRESLVQRQMSLKGQSVSNAG